MSTYATMSKSKRLQQRNWLAKFHVGKTLVCFFMLAVFCRFNTLFLDSMQSVAGQIGLTWNEDLQKQFGVQGAFDLHEEDH
jgi:hypothetical protein